MKNKGWICLYRKIMDDPIWLAEPFTRGQAWVDLLMLANHKGGYIRKRGIRIDLKRGDVGWSERELAKRWKWSRGKVGRFLADCCFSNKPKMIPQTGPQNKNVTSYYSIINYDRYQGNGPQNGPQTGHKQYQNNNDNNDKNKYSCPHKQIVDLYHEKLSELPKVKVWSEERQAALRARWNQAVSNNTGMKSNCIEWWAGYFDFIHKSDFLMGRVDPLLGRKRFVPNLEWLVKKKSLINILEGKYHG